MRIITLVACLIALSLCKYDYEDQNNWASPCDNGQRQSPIDIITNRVNVCPPTRSFTLHSKNERYTQTPKRAEDLITTFKLSTIQYSKGKAAPIKYHSLQFHFHRKSEHTFNGRHHDLELHIVHQAQIKLLGLAVYGVLFKVKNGDFEDPFDDWNLDTTIDREQYFPLRLDTPRSVFHYQGSLTTPSKPNPCAEIVRWFVNGEVIPIKQSSLDKMVQLIYTGSQFGNWRYTQPLKGRTVTELGTKCANRNRLPQHRPPSPRPSRHYLLSHQ